MHHTLLRSFIRYRSNPTYRYRLSCFPYHPCHPYRASYPSFLHAVPTIGGTGASIRTITAYVYASAISVAASAIPVATPSVLVDIITPVEWESIENRKEDREPSLDREPPWKAPESTAWKTPAGKSALPATLHTASSAALCNLQTTGSI